jgi:hypothetical protein
MKLTKYLIFSFLIISIQSFANSNLDNCLGMARGMNSQLPKKIDFITTLDATSCIEDKGQIYFQYVHTISDSSSLPKDIQRQAKVVAKKQYCSNSEFVRALNYFNFEFYYLDSRRKPLYTFTLTKSDC